MWRKLLFFSLLYFVQGAALAYIVNFQKPYLSGKGVPVETLGFFTGLLLLPFIIKVGLGYLSDRAGTRKPFMIGALLAFALCFFALAKIDPGESFTVFAAVMWTASLALAWFDTCADGWAVDTATDKEQSAVQAAMVAGKSLGLVTMSVTFGFLAMRHGFWIIFVLIGALALAVLTVVLFVKPPKKPLRSGEIVHGWGGLLKDHYVFFALFACFYAVSSMGTDGLVTLHLSKTREAGTMDIGLFGMWRGIGALNGAVAYALIRPRLGIKPAQYLALVLLASGCLIPLLDLGLVPYAVLWGACWGFMETSFVTLAMKFAQGRWAATLFAGSMIFSNVGNALGEALGAPLVPTLGFNGVFAMYAGIAIATAAFLPKAFKPVKD